MQGNLYYYESIMTIHVKLVCLSSFPSVKSKKVITLIRLNNIYCPVIVGYRKVVINCNKAPLQETFNSYSLSFFKNILLT